jgi:hypothetical protein
VKASISKIPGLLLKYIPMVQSGFNEEPIQRDSTLGGLLFSLTKIKHYRSPLSVNSYAIINFCVSFHTNPHLS